MAPLPATSLLKALGLALLVVPQASASRSLQSNVTNTTRSCQKTKVAVLGAGMAGITAAHALANASVDDFLIVEYNDYIGGRMRHTQFGNDTNGNPLTVEVGANWVQGLQAAPGDPENPIWRLAQKWQLNTTYCDYNNVTTYDQNGPANFSYLLDTFDDYYSTVEWDAGVLLTRDLQDRSFRAGLSLSGWKPRDQYEKSAEWWQFDWEYIYPPSEASQLYTIANYNSSFYQWSEDDNFVVDQRGFNTILTGEASEFLKTNDTRLLLNTIVRKIKYSDSGVTVYHDDGCIEADYAICTFSIGVLQNDVVKFEPELPDWKQQSIATFQMGTYTKIFMQFEEQFWQDTQFSWYADPIQRGYYTAWQNLNADGYIPGSNIFFVTVLDDLSHRVEKQTKEETKAQAMAVLSNMFPGLNVPEPTAMLFYPWSSEPWVYGSFSNWPPGTSLEMHQNLRANVGRLSFAGEGTSQNYYGYLQGAYFEGLYMGEKIADCVNGASCDDEAHYATLLGVAPDNQYNITNGWMVSSFETYGYY